MERGDALGKLARVIFAQEKVVVVELHRVDPVLLLQVAEDGGGAGRRLHLLPVVHRHHPAKIAAEWAADTRLMNRRARAQERARQVLRRVQAMVWRPGKIVGRFQRALGGVYLQAELVLERHAADSRKIARTPQFVEQFEQRVFALAFDHEIDVFGIERSRGIERCEIAAPYDGYARILLPERAAHGYRLEQLRTRHHGDAKQFHAVIPHQRVDRRPRIRVGIAIHNFVIFAAFQHRPQIENG